MLVQKLKTSGLLKSTTAGIAIVALTSGSVFAQNAVSQPAGANAEPAAQTVASGSGFEIVVDGTQASSGNVASSTARRADVALAEADVRVSFDGLNTERRLDLIVMNEKRARVGETVRVESQMNYPAFTTRGEIRVLDMNARGGPRVVGLVPINPNGTATFTRPEGENISIVHRVYDAKGRFDETAPHSLNVTEDAGLQVGEADGGFVEQGTSSIARSRIPVFGGAVTVSGDNVPSGATVQALSETITPDPSGSFVLRRILPPGDQPVAVQVSGAGANTFIERNVTIPRNDWFKTATADLTLGRRFDNPRDASGAPLSETYSYGRIAGYAKGRTANGWNITASADTGEEELSLLFRNLDKKDVQSTLRRAARENAYPTFGDDSTLEDGAPSDGKLYLKAQKGNSHVTWGNYKATVTGSKYLRNERQLYGATGVYRSPAQTTRGQSRVSLELYAANPERLPGRDTFRGTGGSVYFLQRQDLSVASETITVEYRDSTTGRVLEKKTLTEGRDYVINYIQGIVTLSEPLSGRTGSQLLVSRVGGDVDVFLNTQYEYTPSALNVDGTTFGGRAEAWITDNLRVGVTGQKMDTDVANQTALGADIRYEWSERSHVTLEYAQTEGPGFGSSISSNGGLVITNQGSAGVIGRKGEALSLEGYLDFADLGIASEGNVSAYYERRSAGFSTLDYQVSTNDEAWGIGTEFAVSERAKVKLSYDDFSDANGKINRKGEASVEYAISDRATLEAGIGYEEKRAAVPVAGQTGTRTDVVLRYTNVVSDDLTWFAYGQGTVDASGGLKRNDRAGAGIKYRLSEKWSAEAEVSGGTGGTGAAAMLTYEDGDQAKRYIGYRLEPGREFSGVTLNGRDQGTWVAGGRQAVGDNVDIFAENSYDIFGRHKALTSAYGVEYRPTKALTFNTAFEYGQIDDVRDKFDRYAVSLGVRYDDDARIKASAKIEYRLDEGTITGIARDQNALFFNAGLRYKINEEQRIIANVDYARSTSSTGSLPNGNYTDVTLGYALRPIEDDRLNILAKYQYLHDMVGQEIDGVAGSGPRQESHVLSVDASYDISQNWTIGGKVGARIGRSSPSLGVAFQQNDAYLAIANARYHVTHNWDVLLEARHLEARQAGLSESALVGAVYRHVGNNLKVGLGYNMGRYSDDLTDLTFDDKGIFLNLVAKF